MFLTPDDLFILTGYKLPAKQIRWLESHGYPHDVNAAGKPKRIRYVLVICLATVVAYWATHTGA